MRALVFCGLLCIHAVAAVPVANDGPASTEIEEKKTESLEGSPINFSQDMYVFDDDENLVKLDPNQDDAESIDQTRRDIGKRVVFNLYTKQNPKKAEKLLLDDVNSLRNSRFDAKRETKFVTHGWMNSRRSKSCTLVRDAFLQHGDYNVIVIDWSSISRRPYFWTSNRVVMISQYVARMIDFLVSQGMNPSRVTIVGHSLGAHIAGLSSHYARQRVNYVVALDPAQPNFLLAGPGDRVSRGDANYVLVIHTNAGLLGYMASIGDSDFFPNGGSWQTGCTVDIGGSCSHARSYRFFAESINSRVGFVSKKCGSFADFKNGHCNGGTKILMGGVAPQFHVQGKHYLLTNPKSPFAKG